ncbi:MAG: hypothetical protein IKO41_21635 [Lachnospiraceae bacterium]|nr:hypothetical protein [Lachnospiraceae bacterium]
MYYLLYFLCAIIPSALVGTLVLHISDSYVLDFIALFTSLQLFRKLFYACIPKDKAKTLKF